MPRAARHPGRPRRCRKDRASPSKRRRTNSRVTTTASGWWNSPACSTPTASRPRSRNRFASRIHRASARARRHRSIGSPSSLPRRTCCSCSTIASMSSRKSLGSRSSSSRGAGAAHSRNEPRRPRARRGATLAGSAAPGRRCDRAVQPARGRLCRRRRRRERPRHRARRVPAARRSPTRDRTRGRDAARFRSARSRSDSTNASGSSPAAAAPRSRASKHCKPSSTGATACLFDDEQRVFERLAVFAGGCTLDAAEAVCAGDDLPIGDVADLVGRLVDKSLLQAERSGEMARFTMLQTLAQYGREQLAARPEAEAVRLRHAEYFADFGDRGNDATYGENQREWLTEARDSTDDVRAAIDWSIEHDKPELALRIAGGLGWYWWTAGHADEGYRVLERACRCPGEISTLVRARALVWLTYLGSVRFRRPALRPAHRGSDAALPRSRRRTAARLRRVRACGDAAHARRDQRRPRVVRRGSGRGQATGGGSPVRGFVPLHRRPVRGAGRRPRSG